jgi:hypothetical protein
MLWASGLRSNASKIRVEAAKLKTGMDLWQLRVGGEMSEGMAALAD